MSKSLQINGISWKAKILGEKALLLEPLVEANHLEHVHHLSQFIESSSLDGLIDLIPAYKSIALIYDRLLSETTNEIKHIQQAVNSSELKSYSPKKYTVPICYEVGLDWDIVEKSTSLKREEIIEKHVSANYTVAMMGFIPGFLYLHGLDEKLTCPRKENPRTTIPAGSVGIGGSQTGIYSLESPGGWQIIGRTPHSFFNPNTQSPTTIKAGDKLSFERISESEFERLKEEANL